MTGYDHLGAAECYDGKLYVAAEPYHGCGLVTNQSICVFNATDLSRISTTCISNFTTEISAVAIAPGSGANGTVLVSNFCDGAQLYKFDLSNLSYLGALPLDETIPKIQGLTYHGGLIYAVADSGTNGVVYDIDPLSGHVRKTAFLTFPNGKEMEGCDYTTGNFLILVAGRSNYVYYFTLTR